MKYLHFLILISIIAVLITGCDEYTSPVPAGKIKESVIDTNYIGCWDYTGADYTGDSTLSMLEPHYLNVVMFDNNRYILQMVKKDSIKPTSLPGLYEATTCVINGSKIVSVRALSSDKAEYLIYLYGTDGDTLWYRAFQRSKLEKQFSKTPALKKYLTKFLNDTSVMLPVKKYVRTK